MLNLVRPRYFVPDPRRIPAARQACRPGEHLRYVGTAGDLLLESGDVLEIDSRGARKAERCTVGRVCIDSGIVGRSGEDMVIRDRRHLSEDGIVLPIIAINRHTGRVESLPEIVSRGFMSADGG